MYVGQVGATAQRLLILPWVAGGDEAITLIPSAPPRRAERACNTGARCRIYADGNAHSQTTTKANSCGVGASFYVLLSFRNTSEL